ncbi:MAG: hypothetical protein IAE94_16275 [Chthoniobacterales bacterium]|nr:hypothetical protein [Chthoniobacterales bacterium]
MNLPPDAQKGKSIKAAWLELPNPAAVMGFLVFLVICFLLGGFVLLPILFGLLK